ncbi:MAG TPA: SH3 domain-containing protein [Chthoniobacterales bacterium]|nr:SH3 domain-containing protein [Chthoniobacterales bacterium]
MTPQHQSGMPKAPRFSKVGSCILGFCLLSAQLVATHPAGAADASGAVPPKYRAFVPETAYSGVIDDPDGYVNLRAAKRADAPVVAKVKAGEQFSFGREGGDDWCRVKLATGKSGWMHYSRIRLFYTKDDLPAKSDEGDEIEKQARDHGADYYQITRGAVRGQLEARKKFFSVSEYADGAGAEEHWGILGVVIHLIGDEALARFLGGQPVAYRKSVRASFADEVTYPFEPREYLQRHFPKTARILY